MGWERVWEPDGPGSPCVCVVCLGTRLPAWARMASIGSCLLRNWAYPGTWQYAYLRLRAMLEELGHWTQVPQGEIGLAWSLIQGSAHRLSLPHLLSWAEPVVGSRSAPTLLQTRNNACCQPCLGLQGRQWRQVLHTSSAWQTCSPMGALPGSRHGLLS